MNPEPPPIADPHSTAPLPPRTVTLSASQLRLRAFGWIIVAACLLMFGVIRAESLMYLLHHGYIIRPVQFFPLLTVFLLAGASFYFAYRIGKRSPS